MGWQIMWEINKRKEAKVADLSGRGGRGADQVAVDELLELGEAIGPAGRGGVAHFVGGVGKRLGGFHAFRAHAAGDVRLVVGDEFEALLDLLAALGTREEGDGYLLSQEASELVDSLGVGGGRAGGHGCGGS